MEPQVVYRGVGVNTDLTGAGIELIEEEVCRMKIRVQQLEEECVELREKQHFRPKTISNDDHKVRFCTGSAMMSAVMVYFNF